MIGNIMYNLYYYKTLVTSFIFPQSSAVSAYKLFETPKYPPKMPEWEKQFEESSKFNLLKIPFQEHIDIIKERINKNQTQFKFTRVPNLPKELVVYEFLPNPEVPKRKETIICVHGWDGRGLNFFKFIPKLQNKGFKVLAPDFPRHGKTEGIESGCHVFGHSINLLIRYINEPVFVLAHSVGNGAFCVNYGLSNEEEKNLIKRYVGICFPNTAYDVLEFFENTIGISSRCHPYFCEENSKNLGFDINELNIGLILKKFNIPILLIHDKNDKELKFEYASKAAEYLNHKHYKVNDITKPSFFQSEGLGHRRIIRDDSIVERVAEFFSENIELQD